jgi:O-antigen ligase
VLLVAQPRFLALLFGSGFVAMLTVVSPEVFVAIVLLARNVASGTADAPIAAGLNGGALIGVLVIFVVATRLVVMKRPRAVGIASLICVAFTFWFLVGYTHFGPEESIIRELIRSVSIVALALLAVNVPRGPSSDRLISAVILASALPAVIALEQLATGSGYVTEGGSNTGRAYGTFSTPAEAVSVFVIALALVLWRMRRGSRSWQYITLAGMFGVAALATKSMGGVLQLVVTLIAFGILSGRSPRRRNLTILAAVGAAVIFALSPLGRDRLGELGSTAGFSTASRGQQYTTNSVDWRFYNWSVQIEEWRKRPYVGHGAGTTASLIHPGGNIPHSDFIRILVEAGILGLALAGAAYMLLFGRLRSLARAGDDHASYCTAALAILIGLTVHGLTDNVSTQTATMYAAAIVIGCAFAARPGSPEPSSSGWRGRLV